MKKFQTLAKLFDEVVKTEIYVTSRTFWKSFFGGRYNFVSFYGFSEENLTGKKNRVLSGMHSRCPAELSEGIFSRRNKIFQTFGLWARIFGVTDKTHLTELPKLQSMWSEEFLDWNDFYVKKNTTSNPSPEFWWKSSGLLAKLSTSGVKLTTTCPQAHQIKSGRTRKALYVYRGTFRAEKYVTDEIFFALRARREKLPISWWNTFSRFVKTACHVFRETLWDKRIFCEKKKNFFLGADWESFGFLAKRIWLCCQNCSPCDQRSSWNKMIFFKKNNFESFSRDLAKEFWTLGKCIHKVSQIRNLRVLKNCKRKCGRTRKAFYVSSGTFSL